MEMEVEDAVAISGDHLLSLIFPLSAYLVPASVPPAPGRLNATPEFDPAN
jgi:hypothetical protein